jgi:S1-C subfamily serine protease
MELIADYVVALVKAMESQSEVPFRKTKNESEETPRFKVGLGVVPDYLFDGSGMRIDGVSEGKPAQAAGLQKGDIVVKLGDSLVTDMMSYMRALSTFEAGQKAAVEVTRNGQHIQVDVQF